MEIKKMSKKEERRIGDNSFPMAAKLIEAKELILKSISKIEGVRNRAWSNKFIYNDKCFQNTEDAIDRGLDAYNCINEALSNLGHDAEVYEGSLSEVPNEK